MMRMLWAAAGLMVTGLSGVQAAPHGVPPAAARFKADVLTAGKPDQGRVALMAHELARELGEACPFAAPQDARPLEACKGRLYAPRSALRRHLPAFVLWGRMRDAALPLKDTHLTQFGPDVFSATYLPLFMFDGNYTVAYDERQNLYRIDFVAAFRNRLQPGLYPYPFWHEDNKWSIYQGTNRLTAWVGIDPQAGVEKVKVMQFSALGAPHAAVPDKIATPVFDPDTHAKWLWTDAAGRTQPQVTLFDGLFSAGNPHLKSLDEAYRAMALKFRDGDCMSCHVPNNPDKMKRLVLLQTPAHAASEIERVIESVRDDRMPIDEFGIEKPMPTRMKNELLDQAQAFASVLAAARAWEAARSAPRTPAPGGTKG
ncbi:MAG: hypothetical protein JNK75_03980 [Betaproteobacteria bacterium]|nr:hypothetical protein [Betaproteobacteria bacterium]